MEAPLIRRSADARALARDAAEAVLRAAQEAAAARARFRIVLSGGATPRLLYEVMAREPYRSAFPWHASHFFWSDERWVPPDHERSNYKSAWDSLFSLVPVPPDHVHPVRTALPSAAASAEGYELEIRSHFGVRRPAVPAFDFVLLGLGDDGHTASLFPGSPVLQETARLVASAEGPGGEPRVTFTPPLINAASCVAFLVSGASKAAVLRSVLSGEAYPAAVVRPAGRLLWFVDADAAGLIK